MTTTFNINFGGDRFGRAPQWPDLKTIVRLESIISDQYHATQREVHVITGSLRRSGKLDSDVDHTSWTGKITYGGTSFGAENDPVDYARDELFANIRPHKRNADWPYPPGTNADGQTYFNHNFMRPVDAPHFHRRYREAILAWLRGHE